MADLEAEIARVGATLGPGTSVLLWTGADEHIDDPEKYGQHFPAWAVVDPGACC